MRISDRERREFGAQVEGYRQELHLHCYRLMGSIHDAEDMVQETFLRAWRRRETLHEIALLRAWLYKIATHVCLDTLKSRPKRSVPRERAMVSTLDEPIGQASEEPIWLEPYPDALLSTNERNPEEHIVARENITMAFLVALHRLPPRQRAVLLLRDALDWQADEVATLLNTTTSAVKSALHRARATLADQGHSSEDDALWTQSGVAHLHLDSYVQAWEEADITTLLRLLTEDATFSMPPIPSWYRGKESIRTLTSITVFSGEAHSRWRLLPTRANRQPAFGLYSQTDSAGLYSAYGIQLVTHRGCMISDITTFVDATLFSHFNLPETISSSKA